MSNGGEIHGATGQGRTVGEGRENLAAAISLIPEGRREDAWLHL